MDYKSLAVGVLIGIAITIIVLGMNLMSSMDKLHQVMDKAGITRAEGFNDAEYGVVPKVKLFNKARDVDR